MKKTIQKNKGMTYVELIVVLSIFSVLTSIVMFDYGKFQAKVDIKNLASDVALQIVQAQKSSLSGTLPIQTPTTPDPTIWKPSYGVYINKTSDNKSFIYFSDLNDDGLDNDLSCSLPPTTTSGECLDKILITKNDYISNLSVFYEGNPTPSDLNDLTITFMRPNTGAIIRSTQIVPAPVSYVQITISSPNGSTGTITLYPSGRIQVN